MYVCLSRHRYWCMTAFTCADMCGSMLVGEPLWCHQVLDGLLQVFDQLEKPVYHM